MLIATEIQLSTKFETIEQEEDKERKRRLTKIEENKGVKTFLYETNVEHQRILFSGELNRNEQEEVGNRDAGRKYVIERNQKIYHLC